MGLLCVAMLALQPCGACTTVLGIGQPGTDDDDDDDDDGPADAAPVDATPQPDALPPIDLQKLLG